MPAHERIGAATDRRLRTVTVAGIVLRQYSLGERDRIVVLYTRERGKLTAVAKGARQPRSKLAAITQPLTYGRFTIARGKTLGVLTQGLLEEAFFLLKQDLWRTSFATCAIELLDKTVPEGDVAPEIFNLILASLYQFQDSPDPEVVLRFFQLQLLRHLGYLPTLQRCARCNNPIPDIHGACGVYLFHSEQGGVICNECRPHAYSNISLGAQTIQAMLALQCSEPTVLGSLAFSPRVMAEMRRALDDFIQFRLDVNLKSNQFLIRLRRMRNQTTNAGQ